MLLEVDSFDDLPQCIVHPHLLDCASSLLPCANSVTSPAFLQFPDVHTVTVSTGHLVHNLSSVLVETASCGPELHRDLPMGGSDP